MIPCFFHMVESVIPFLMPLPQRKATAKNQPDNYINKVEWEILMVSGASTIQILSIELHSIQKCGI